MSAAALLADRVAAAAGAARPRLTGRVRQLLGSTVEVEGVEAAIGDAVHIERGDHDLVPAEVVAVRADTLVCQPLGDLTGVRAGAPVEADSAPLTVPVGPALLGRVLDGLGRPLDGALPPDLERATVHGVPPHPLRRQRVTTPLPLGVRALDTLVPFGRGQRTGIFAGSGVGKSTLLSMIARGSAADVVVLALVGERGREVREFIEDDLGPDGLARSVVVVATAEEPPLVRMRAALTATRIAEWFRDAGRDVLLMMDSLTRVAMAAREIGLAAGEPPTTRGYPPSVFTLLPRLLERAGAGETGSISALYTVLVEGDDLNDPIGDAARSLLDGHVVLSRRLATSGHYPSIDVLESVSRLDRVLTTPEQRAAATELRGLLAAERDARDLVEIGAYAAGSNPTVDRALQLKSAANAFLQQATDETVPVDQSWAALQALLARPGDGS